MAFDMFFIILLCITALTAAQCPDYTSYSSTPHGPFSGGIHNLSYQRPDPNCRTYYSAYTEAAIIRLKSVIIDPDLSRLFENSFPNTLDTTVKWTGHAANNSAEELAFVITGDIDAMWLRDSANQLQSYLPLLNTTATALSSLYRGVINLQSRYLLISPYCNAFQPPIESGLQPNQNGASDTVPPHYDPAIVFECKYELDSLAAFLELSTNYYTATGDLSFFANFQWLDAVRAVLNTATSMAIPTYAPNGSVNKLPYTFTRSTPDGLSTLNNRGTGNPVQSGTTLLRSSFRPSDDATIFQFLIPSNMIFARTLSTASLIASALNATALANEMTSLSSTLTTAITTHGIISDPTHGTIYAYEVDGYGSRNMMDDANIPSLLSAPFFRYLSANDTVYQNTRNVLLSADNPYFMRGPIISANGGPHDTPGYAWPMASIVRILTSSSTSSGDDDNDEIYTTLKELVASTNGLGLLHESINTFNAADYTRPWFAWVNGLFGQMILDLEKRKPEVLARSFG
ncbi:hypothetical protein N7G274_008279 [Stereocaulon virgatum]|uniref:Glycoside hydrolase family 125 protein n=1 Tax=Stereocaulon virgatum TaxID=373712 RepID=A0ABR3ZZ22_9LECA